MKLGPAYSLFLVHKTPGGANIGGPLGTSLLGTNPVSDSLLYKG